MNVQYAIQRDTVFVLEVIARVAHRAVRQQSDRSAAGESCGAVDDREEIARHELTLLCTTILLKLPCTNFIP